MPGKYEVIVEGMSTHICTTLYEGADSIQAALVYARITRRITRMESSDTVSFYADGALLEQCQPVRARR
jgi:hypothetical protein